jgi:hypothetical protein
VEMKNRRVLESRHLILASNFRAILMQYGCRWGTKDLRETRGIHWWMVVLRLAVQGI